MVEYRTHNPVNDGSNPSPATNYINNMKVKDLLFEIKKRQEEYGEEFLEWDVYTEQLDEDVKKQNNYEYIICNENWEYYKCYGFWTKIPKKKIFTININY